MKADNIIVQGIVICTEMLDGSFPITLTCSDPAYKDVLGSQ